MRVGEFAYIGDGSAWSAWLDVVYLEDRRVRLRTTSRAWGGGWGGGFVGVVASRAVLGSCIALRASAVAASLRWVWRVRAAEASVMCGLVGVRVLPLRWVRIPCDYARLRVRGGGGEGSFVCQFACRVYAIVSVSAVCACAWSRGCSFACLLRLRDLWVRWYLWYLWYLRTCVFACLQ